MATLTRWQPDEDDVRVRAARRGSRPRTKERPSHRDARLGVVLTVDRGRYTCRLLDPGGTGGRIEHGGVVTAMRARELGRGSVVVGDEVAMVGDLSGAAGTLARIVRVEPRRTVLRRTADDDDPYERVIVANADQLVIVASLAEPPPRVGLVDRCLVAAYVGGLDPLLCLTKTDLVEGAGAASAVLDLYAGVGLPAVTTGRDTDLTELRHRLAGRTSVLVGHSGVGKSTLVNLLVPRADRATGVVSAVGRGRHTSSSAVALPLADQDGWVIDTPGIRSFGLAHVAPDDLLAALPDLAEGAQGCPPGCDHTAAAVGCALDRWVAEGGSSPARLSSYRRLLASRSTDDR